VNGTPDEYPERILWLFGVAGSGKSAIAHTIAHRFRDLQRLGSLFCFDASDRTRGPAQLLPTITRNLADFDPEWKKSLLEVIGKSLSDRTTSSLDIQFTKFFLEPAMKLTAVGPILIIVDALDESGDKSIRASLLRIFSRLQELPANFRILVTSRPEEDIMAAFDRTLGVRIIDMSSVGDESTDEDMRCFISSELSSFSTELDSHWPEHLWIEELVRVSDHLFQWAATACKFVQGIGQDGLEAFDSVERLRFLITEKGKTEGDGFDYDPLDGLYRTILSRVCGRSEGARRRILDALSLVLSTREPIPLTTVRELFEMRESQSLLSRVLGPLGSLLHGIADQRSPVRPLHASFRDFITIPERSGPYCVDLSPQHLRLAHACIRVMRTQLKFNICHLQTSYLRNHEIIGLEDLTKRHISDSLSYSCQFWPDHVHLSLQSENSALFDELRRFLEENLMFWLEVMSLLGRLAIALSGLRLLRVHIPPQVFTQLISINPSLLTRPVAL
jgi:hypothetical protein